MAGRRNRAGRGGFTLLEILLVVVIVGIASAVAVPAFARSFRGAKLRASVRSVLAMHRHAQTKAVLGQTYMVLLCDARQNSLEVAEQGRQEARKDEFFGELDGGGSMGDVVTGGEAPPDAAGPAPVTRAERRLEEGVKILSFRGGQEFDEIHYVSYYPNGMCEAFEIEIGDDQDRVARIRVDPVTGRAKVRRD